MQVIIVNFQSLQQVDILVEGLTVIVGGSNIGKSALVRAISSAFYGRLGDDFVRRGASTTNVSIFNAPKVDGGTFNVEWHKGKGANYFVIDGAKYDKVARDTPVHLEKFGYRDVEINGEYIRPQVSEQFDRMFLLDRAGSFVHDVIAQASRLSVLLRADRSCSADLKRQRSTQKLRVQDLADAQAKLEKMAPISELHGRIQELRPRMDSLKALGRRLDDLRVMAKDRALLGPATGLALPRHKTLPGDFLFIAEGIQKVQTLARDRKIYLGLPEDVPSAKTYDFEGMLKLSSTIDTAKRLSLERKQVYSEYIEAQSAFKSISQDLEMTQAELQGVLSKLDICPVCEQPIPKADILTDAERVLEFKASIKHA